jgi:hypothetical protein
MVVTVEPELPEGEVLVVDDPVDPLEPPVKARTANTPTVVARMTANKIIKAPEIPPIATVRPRIRSLRRGAGLFPTLLRLSVTCFASSQSRLAVEGSLSMHALAHTHSTSFSPELSLDPVV